MRNAGKLQQVVERQVDDETARPHRAKVQELGESAEFRKVQAPQMAQVVELLAQCHLAVAVQAVPEPDGYFFNPVEVPPHHELQTNLVANRAQCLDRNPPAVKADEARHRIRTGHQRFGKGGRGVRIEESQQVPVFVEAAAFDIAAANPEPPRIILQSPEHLRHDVGRVGKIRVHHDDRVESCKLDSLHHRQ